MGKLEQQLKDKILRISSASDPDTIPPTHVSEPIDLLRRIVDIRTSEKIFRSDELFSSDLETLADANSCIRALYFAEPLQDGHRYVLTYLYHWGDAADFKISIDDYDESDGTTTTIVDEFQFEGDQLTDLEDGEGNVIGKIFASVSGYSGAVSQADVPAIRMPYCNEVCWNLNQAKILDTKIGDLKQQADGTRDDLDALTENIFPTLFGTLGEYPSDVAKCAAANAEVKALYLEQKPSAGHRYVLAWLYLQTSDNSWHYSIVDLNESLNTINYVVQSASAVDKTVCPIVNFGGTQIGLIYLDSDYYSLITDEGEGKTRMPYLLPAAYEQLNQQILLNAEVDETATLARRTVTRVDSIEEELFPTLLGTAGTEASDVVKCAAANAEVKALYLNVQPASGHRFVLYTLYLQTSDNSWYITIKDLNVSAGTSTTLVNYIHVDDKQMSVLTDTSGNTIGWILLDSDSYTYIADQGEGAARLPYLLAPAFDMSTQTRLFRQAVSEQLASIERRMAKKQILCWGDSITWGSAATANSKCFASLLQTLLTDAGYLHKVVNCGVGGDNMPTIVGRMGGTMLYLTKDLTIPKSSSSYVVVDTVEDYVQVGRYLKASIMPTEQIQLMMQGDLGRSHIDDPERDLFHTVNPVVVNGVECVWSWEPEEEGHTDEGEFRLAVADTQEAAVVLKAGSPIYTHGPKIRSDVAVFAMGTNAGWSTVEEYIKMVDAAIDASGTKKYIVCSPYGGTALTQQGVEGLQALEAALTAKYGAKYFNWRKYLVEEGLTVEGITATADDSTAIAAGLVPPSLLADEVHPNDYGHDAIARRLYQMMQSLGYFD